MSKMDNFRKAAFDMFGVGTDIETKSDPSANMNKVADKTESVSSATENATPAAAETAAPETVAATTESAAPAAEPITPTTESAAPAAETAASEAESVVIEAEEVSVSDVPAPIYPHSQTMVSNGTPYVLVPATYLAPGTVMEGTLHSKGDVEIAGCFKGDIVSEGNVTLHTNIDGNISANNLSLVDCEVTGDCNVTSVIKLDSSSSISGNLNASELQCSGKVNGQINIKGLANFESTSVIDANITAGSIAMERGAKITGQLNMA